MKKTVKIASVIFFCLFALVSCRREELSIRNCEVKTVEDEDGVTYLEVLLSADIPDISHTKMTVKDPSGDLLWSVKPEKITFDGMTYTGNLNIAIPKGFAVPSGQWSVELVYKDGRTVSRTFSLVSDSPSDQLE